MAMHSHHRPGLVVSRSRCLLRLVFQPGGGHQPPDLGQDHVDPQSWALPNEHQHGTSKWSLEPWGNAAP